MKKLTNRETKSIHSINKFLNQKVMKTKKYSILKKAVVAAMFSFVFSAFLNAQWDTPSPDNPFTQLTTEEVRTGSSTTYDVDNNHTAGEWYRWVVRGGTITAGGTVTTDLDSSIIEWTQNAHTITVQWDDDLLPVNDSIGSGQGEVIVQKRNAGACPSQLQIMNVDRWNDPTATLADPALAICSGEAVGGNVNVGLTGAPAVADGFTVTYSITAAGLTDLLDNPLANLTGQTVLDNDAFAQIPLPNGLINPTGSPIDYVVTLTAVTDDFDTPDPTGAIIGDGTYTITVNPVPATGDIESGFSLTRR